MTIDLTSFRKALTSLDRGLERAERGFIDNTADWFAFREERNISAHTYDAAKAAEVYRAALKFRHSAPAFTDAPKNGAISISCL